MLLTEHSGFAEQLCSYLLAHGFNYLPIDLLFVFLIFKALLLCAESLAVIRIKRIN